MYQDFFSCTLIVLSAYIARKSIITTPEYLETDPSAYRLAEIITLFLYQKYGVSIRRTLLVIWTLSMVSTYFILRPYGPELLLFQIIIIGLAARGYIRQAPLYPLLALVRILPIAVIPLGIIKEIGLFIGIIFLILDERIFEAIMWGGLGSILYIAIRKIQGSRTRLGETAPLFTPPVWRKFLSSNKVNKIVDISISSILVVFALMYNPLFLILCAIPIFLFALPWEPQLWAPFVILTIGIV